jgi:hypothetical protein
MIADNGCIVADFRFPTATVALEKELVRGATLLIYAVQEYTRLK